MGTDNVVLDPSRDDQPTQEPPHVAAASHLRGFICW